MLHELVEQFVLYASKYQQVLFDVIRYSKDSNKRRKAAQLIAWSKHTDKLAYVAKWDLLNDPSEEVRNDLSRSLLFLLNKVQDKSLLIELLPAYCQQASLPSHADRNKALLSILTILQNDPSMSQTINDECRCTIKYIEEMSVLINAGGLAKQISKIMTDARPAS